jgi:GNAT superfamily N-acetyltransferase/uncharacterized damage-inducible protein DinB
MSTIELRPATLADSGFCFALHRVAMGPYVQAIWGWDDATQLEFHERGFDPARTQIVTVDGRDAGSLTVDYRSTEIYLGRIEIHPDHQGRGIGGQLIRTLLTEAASHDRPVILDVLAVNQRAHALYRRLGFQEVGRHGPDNIKIRMAVPAGRFPATLDGPGVDVSDPRELLLGYLDWYREALMRKVAGLSDAQLRTPVAPLGWSPLGLIRHLGWVERRWMRWGFAAEDIVVSPADWGNVSGDDAEWGVPDGESTGSVMSAYLDEVRRSRSLAEGAALTERARVGGRFRTVDEAPSLGRILFHLLQEYARHVGQLDVARELIDGVTGE